MIRNYYTGSTSHCFSSYNLCPIDNYHCLLESTLVNEIFNRRLKIGSLLNFTSMMLNYLESGVELESTILRPKSLFQIMEDGILVVVIIFKNSKKENVSMTKFFLLENQLLKWI